MGFKLRPGTSVFGNVTFTPGTNENYVAPPVHGGPVSTNIALTATSTASTHISDRPPSLAHDGIIGISDTDGSTISGVNAWVTTGERVGAWMQLDWSTPQTVNKIKLYDRPNVTHDHIKGGTLTFSDGSSVTVGELPDGVVNGSPDPLEVTFDAKTITWVRFTVDAFTGHNAGLTEFEVFGYEYQAPAPEPAPASEPQILPLSSAVSLLMDASATADGSVVDGSTNNHSITVNGDVTQSSFSPYRSGGYSLYNTGTNHIEKTGLTAPGTGDFTVEAWVYVTNSSANQMIWDTRPISVDNTTGMNAQFRSNNVLYAGSANVGYITGTTTFNDNEWVHVALVRSGGTLTLYGNGVSQGSISHSVNLTSTDINIGSNRSGASVFNGYIRDLRVVNDAVYTGDFTPSTSPLTSISNTALLTCNLPYVSSDLTITGDVYTKPFSPYDYAGYSESLHGGSYVFDGNGDFISVPLSDSLQLSSEDYTVESWFYMDGNIDFAGNAIVSKGTSGQSTIPFYTLEFDTSNVLKWFVQEHSTSSPIVSSSPLTPYQWYHVAVTRSGSTHIMYINGVAVSTNTVSYTMGSGGDTFRVGCGWYATNREFKGSISDLRIVKGTAVYTEDFTPSTAPLEAVTGTSLLLSGNNAAIRDESQTTEKLTVHGSIPSSDSSPYGSGKSMDFSGSYITSSDGIDFSDNDFTIELWWYPTDTGRQGLFHGSYGADWSIGIDYNSTYNNPTLGFWASSNGSSWDIANSDPGGNGITTGSPTQNAWNHIAYVRNGSTLTMYLNGVNVGEVTGVTAPIHSKTNTHQQSIGTWWKATGWGGGPMSGNVADYRISLEAVYTENFSVPTAPLGDYSESTPAPAPAPAPEPEPAPAPEPEPEPYTDPVWPVLLDRAVYNSTEGTGSGTLTFGDWTYGSIFDNGQGTRHPIGTVTDQGLRIQAPHWSGGDWWIEPDTSGKVQVEIIGRYDNFEGSYSRIDLFLTNGPVDSTDTPDLVIVSEGTQGSDTFMVYAYLNGNSRITIRTLNTINGVSTIEKVTLL